MPSRLRGRSRLLTGLVLSGLALYVVLGLLPRRGRPATPVVPPLAELDPADTQAVAVAHWPGFPLLPDGRFPIGAWCCPPPRSTTDARYAEYAGAGLNVSFGMLEDPFLPLPSLRRLQVSRRHGVYAIVRDKRVDPDEARRAGWRARVDSTARAYGNQPALLGYFLADEPDPALFSSLGALNRRFAKRDTRHPGYANLLSFAAPGSAYGGLCYTNFLRSYLRQVRPAFFSIDNYSLLAGSDAPYFITNLDSTAMVSRETGVPFWAVLQLTPHRQFRELTLAELAWQAHLALAHGARGIVWFTYWTPNPAESFHYRGGPISYDGRRNPSYHQLARLDPQLQALGREMSRFQALGVRHVGSVPYGCQALRPTTALRIEASAPLAVGFFREPRGPSYALLVNRDYRRAAGVRVLARGALMRWGGSPGDYRRMAAESPMSLGPGEAQLIRLPLAIDYLN